MSASAQSLPYSTLESWKGSLPTAIEARTLKPYQPNKPFLSPPIATARKPGELATMAASVMQSPRSPEDLALRSGVRSLGAKPFPPEGTLRVDSYMSTTPPSFFSNPPTVAAWEAGREAVAEGATPHVVAGTPSDEVATHGSRLAVSRLQELIQGIAPGGALKAIQPATPLSTNAPYGTLSRGREDGYAPRPSTDGRPRASTPSSLPTPAITSAGIRTLNSRDSTAASILDPTATSTRLSATNAYNNRSSPISRRLAPLPYDAKNYTRSLGAAPGGDVLQHHPGDVLAASPSIVQRMGSPSSLPTTSNPNGHLKSLGFSSWQPTGGERSGERMGVADAREYASEAAARSGPGSSSGSGQRDASRSRSGSTSRRPLRDSIDGERRLSNTGTLFQSVMPDLAPTQQLPSPPPRSPPPSSISSPLHIPRSSPAATPATIASTITYISNSPIKPSAPSMPSMERAGSTSRTPSVTEASGYTSYARRPDHPTNSSSAKPSAPSMERERAGSTSRTPSVTEASGYPGYARGADRTTSDASARSRSPASSDGQQGAGTARRVSGHALSSSSSASSYRQESVTSTSMTFSSAMSGPSASPNVSPLLGSARIHHRRRSSGSDREQSPQRSMSRLRGMDSRVSSSSEGEGEDDDDDDDFPSLPSNTSMAQQEQERLQQPEELQHNSAMMSMAVANLRQRTKTAVTPGKGCVGLNNLGNTCYMNSILQSLNSVPELVAWFLHERAWGSRSIVAPGYADLVNRIWTAPYSSVVSPNNFLGKVARYDNRWSTGRQQDSQEFLHSLLEVLQAETNRVHSKPDYKELAGKGSEADQAAEAEAYARSWYDSVIDDIFGGLVQSTTECQVCKHVSHCFDPSLDLTIPIPEKKRGCGPINVRDCMAAFSELERMDSAEGYKCEACKRPQPTTKRMQIYRYPKVLVLTLNRFNHFVLNRPMPLPQVLVLTLKRFSQNSGTFSRFSFASKNSASVAIDERLDLGAFCSPMALKVAPRGSLPPTYELIAVSHHSGSLGGGHYTAQGRAVSDGHWYDFNDTFVRKETRVESTSSTAYVLFYRLVGLNNPML